MKRPDWRAVAACAGVVVLLGGAWQSPRAMRHMDAFRVEQVEVRGTRYLAPAEVLATAGIGAGSSVWDDSERWLAALRRHPLVRDARIERRLPSTLRVTVEETAPVALVRTPTLQPVDAEGRVLPIAPEQAGLDLPIVAGAVRVGADGVVTDDRTRALVASYAALTRMDAELGGLVSEVGGDAVALRLLLRLDRPALVTVPAGADRERLLEVRTALEDLVRRGEFTRLRALDGRFRDQVVVDLYPTESS